MRAPGLRFVSPIGRAASHNRGMRMPRFWLAMQIVIVVCVLISAVIVLIKL